MSAEKRSAGTGVALGHMRLIARLSIEEASELTDYTVDELQAIESGEKVPGPTSIMYLSRVYARQVAGKPPLPPDLHEGRPEPVREMRTCEVRGCIDEAHPYVDGVKDDMCFSLGVGDSDSPPYDVWYVAGYRDEESGRWAAFTEAPEFGELEGASGLAAIERFALAFRTVQQHCDTLNKLERSTP